MTYEFEKHTKYSGLLMIIGLVITIITIIKPTPLIISLYMSAGLSFVMLAIILYLYVVINDLKQHEVI